MRKKIQQKLRLVSNWSDHSRGRQLEKMSELLDAAAHLLTLVFQDLVGEGDASRGREALSADLVLRALIVKQLNGFSYEDLAFALGDSNAYRTFCRLGIGSPAPSKSALQRSIKRIRPETLEAIRRAIVGQAEALGVEAGEKVRVDTTVPETNIHAPTERPVPQ